MLFTTASASDFKTRSHDLAVQNDFVAFDPVREIVENGIPRQHDELVAHFLARVLVATSARFGSWIFASAGLAVAVMWQSDGAAKSTAVSRARSFFSYYPPWKITDVACY